MTLPIDVGVARLDGVVHRFVAHLVARRSWWWGPVVVIANAEFVGPHDVAPRAHPGDARLDLLRIDRMGVRDRLAAWRRLGSGTHLPHPAIATARRRSHHIAFDRPVRVDLDGRRVGRVRDIDVEVEPDALSIVV